MGNKQWWAKMKKADRSEHMRKAAKKRWKKLSVDGRKEAMKKVRAGLSEVKGQIISQE
jgi:hypothetical protein